MISKHLNEIERKYSLFNSIHLNFNFNNLTFDDEVVILEKFELLFQEYGYPPNLVIKYLDFLQIVNNPEIYSQYELEDLKNVYQLIFEHSVHEDGILGYLYFISSVINEKDSLIKNYIKTIEFINRISLKVDDIYLNKD